MVYLTRHCAHTAILIPVFPWLAESYVEPKWKNQVKSQRNAQANKHKQEDVHFELTFVFVSFGFLRSIGLVHTDKHMKDTQITRTQLRVIPSLHIQI
jgi:hypothetical protein